MHALLHLRQRFLLTSALLVVVLLAGCTTLTAGKKAPSFSKKAVQVPGMLTVFNQARRTVSPQASDMVELTWDSCLGAATQAYCQKAADNGGWDGAGTLDYSSCGSGNYQNLYRDMSQNPVDDARYRSLDIAKVYNAKTGVCSGASPGPCSTVQIYLNIVASNTVRVACSAVACLFSPKKVCECCGMYTDPTITPVVGNASWTPGTPCSHCPSGYNKYCDSGLCSNQCLTKSCQPL